VPKSETIFKFLKFVVKINAKFPVEDIVEGEEMNLV
jgi:hypothetical protein